MPLRLRALAAIALSCVTSACGGGSTQAIPFGSTYQPTLNNTQTVRLSADTSTAQLPPSGGFSGSVTFPGISGTSSLTITSSTTAPGGFALAGSTLRHPQSGTLTIFFFLTIIAQTTITFPSLPRLKLELPPAFARADQQFYYAIEQPAPKGVALAFQTEGPGTTSGASAIFDASLTPLTLAAGQRYVVAFYALSTNNVSADNLLYVANAGSNSITAYPLSAQGNAVPVRTIAGPATGLSDPIAIAVDPDGNLVVGNALPNQTGSIEVFADGANGNIRPFKSFAITGTPEAITVDPFDASIYVGVPGPLPAAIAIYSPAGNVLRSISGIEGGHPIFFNSMAIDNNDDLLLDAGIQFSDHGVEQILSIAPHASGNVVPTNSIADLAEFAGLAFARKTDRIFTTLADLSASRVAVDELQNGSLATLQVSPNAGFQTLATDPLGENVFGIDPIAAIPPAVVFHCKNDGSTGCILQNSISGKNTGLAPPLRMAVGNP